MEQIKNSVAKEEALFRKFQEKARKLNKSICFIWFTLLFVSAYIIFIDNTENLGNHIPAITFYVIIVIAGFLIFYFARKEAKRTKISIDNIFEQLAEAKNNFWLLIENAPFPIFVFDESKRLKFLNKEASIISEYEQDELKDIHIDEIFEAKDELLRTTSMFFMPAGNTTKLITKNGNEKTVLLRTQKLVLEKEILFNAIAIDISKETEIKNKLKETNRINEVTQSLALSGGCKFYVEQNKIIPTANFHNIFNLPLKEEYSLEEFLATIGEACRNSLLIRLDTLKKNKDNFIVEYSVRQKNSDKRLLIRQICELEINDKGEKIIWGAFHDITEIARQKELLINEKEKYFRLINNIPAGIILLNIDEMILDLRKRVSVTDKLTSVKNFTIDEVKAILSKLNILEINREIVEFFGVEMRSIMIEHFINLLSDSDIFKLATVFPFLLSEKTNLEKSFRIHHPIFNQSVDIRVILRKYKENNKEYLILITSNITNYKKIQRELFNTNKMLKNFLNSIPFFVISYDKNANLTFVNNKTKEILGKNSSQLHKMNFFDLFADQDERKHQYFHFKRKMEGQEKTGGNFSNLIKSAFGTKRIFWYNEIMYDENGNPSGILSLGVDITDENRKKHELNKSYKELIELKNRLEKQNKELERAKRTLQEREKLLENEIIEKDKIFSVIAHDIRSPFGGLLSGLQFINESYDLLEPAEVKEFVHNSYISAKRVFSLIESLLEWSRARLDKLELNFINLSLKPTIDNIILLFKEQAEHKEISIINEIEKDICINVDKPAFESIIRNLISNALKFTNRKGNVKINAKELSEKIVEIRIKDNGVGIPEDKLKTVFKFENKFSTRGTENERGSGIGLKVVGEFVKKLGGRIYVDSKVGEGTEFIIHLKKSECED